MCIDRYAVTYRWALLEVGTSAQYVRVAPSLCDPWLATGSDRRGARGGPSRVSLGKVVLTPVRVCLPVRLLWIDGGRARCCRGESRVRILTHCCALCVVLCDHPSMTPCDRLLQASTRQASVLPSSSLLGCIITCGKIQKRLAWCQPAVRLVRPSLWPPRVLAAAISPASPLLGGRRRLSRFSC